MLNPSKVVPLTPFGTFMGATPVLPSMYWDVYSAEQRWKAIGKLLKKLCEYVEYMGDEINVDRDTINQLLEEFEKFKESGFFDYYAAQIEQWVHDNMRGIIEQAIKMVFFGLTEDGYFCAWIPDSWSEIWFDTGANYSRSDYGCLMILFQADGATEYTYVSDFDTLEQMIHDGDAKLAQMIVDGDAALSERLDRTENTLYTDVSEGGE